MKLDNLKYGFLISVTTLFGGSVSELYAQDDSGQKVRVESNEAYKKQFMQSVNPQLDKIQVDFVVDSVETKISNGELLPDVNIIQLLAYLDQDSDEYQTYMASRHIVAHEMWHRICMMNEVLEKPMSATQYRTGRDNFEISASIVQLLTFRDDYIHATPEQRLQLHKLDDPKIKMYLLAVDNDIIRPLSNDKKDFDFEMEFIAKSVAGYWNNNLAVTYAPRHNAMTEKAKRQEFKSPVYEKNFVHDIKVMNHIGGIDFSKLYNYQDVRFLKKFKQAAKPDMTELETSLGAPNFETWLNKKSQLKRFSKQAVEIPNFTGNRLAEERERRPLNQRAQPFEIADMSIGYKAYPLMKVPFYSAVTLRKNKTIYNLYPHGAMDVIQQPDAQGVSRVKTLYIDGSREEGQLRNGVKVGTFRFFDKNKKIIATATYKNNRAVDGNVALPAVDGYILYTYKAGNLVALQELSTKGVKKTICRIENGKPINGLVPVVSSKDNRVQRSYQAYQDGKLVAALIFDDMKRLKEKQQTDGKTIRIERFYDTGALKYQAVAEVPSPLATALIKDNLGPIDKTDVLKHTTATKAPSPLATALIKDNLGPIDKTDALKHTTATKAPSPLTPISQNSSENIDLSSSSPMSKGTFTQTQTMEMPKNMTASLEPTLPITPNNMVKTTITNPIIPQNSAVPLHPTHDKKINLQAPLHPAPILLQETLLSAQGEPVMALSKHENGKKSMKVKVKEFFEVLKKTTLPKTDKQLLMSGILKLRHKILPRTADKPLSSDKQFLEKSPSSKKEFVALRTNQLSLQKTNVMPTQFSRSTQVRVQKISLLKNKFRFLALKQRGIDKS